MNKRPKTPKPREVRYHKAVPRWDFPFLNHTEQFFYADAIKAQDEKAIHRFKKLAAKRRVEWNRAYRQAQR